MSNSIVKIPSLLVRSYYTVLTCSDWGTLVLHFFTCDSIRPGVKQNKQQGGKSCPAETQNWGWAVWGVNRGGGGNGGEGGIEGGKWGGGEWGVGGE